MNRIGPDLYHNIIKYITKTPCGTVYPLSVAEMNQYGDVFTGNDSVLLWHYGGFAFIYGKCDTNFLEQIYRKFFCAGASLPRRFILFTADKEVEQFFRSKEGITFGKRYHLEHTQAPTVPSDMLPPGFHITEFSKELLEKAEGKVIPGFAWRNAEEFLRNGMGFCAVHEDIPAAWAFSAAVSSEEIDIGIETASAYQHMGLATAAAEKMIQYCYEHDKRPVWSCDSTNIASRRLAEKVGFEVVSEYTTIKIQ